MPHAKSHDKPGTPESSWFQSIWPPSASSAASSTSCEVLIAKQGRKDRFAEANDRIDAAASSMQGYLGHPNGIVKKLEDKYGEILTDVSNLSDITSPLLSALPDVVETSSVKEITDKLMNGIPALLRLLDDVAQIHPFIKLAVGTFRVAVGLHLARKENNEKVSLLLVSMRDVMAVLVQLKGISEHKCAGKGNITVAIYMQGLIEQTTEDITNCANSCDTYVKTYLLTKVLFSSSWSEDFKQYTERFAARRNAFVLALSIYTGQAMNAANEKLDSAHSKLDTAHSKIDATSVKVAIIDEKIDRVLSYLATCMSPEERELQKLVKDGGGPEKVMENESLLRTLFDGHKSRAGVSDPGLGGPHREVDDFKALQKELQNGVQTTIRENMVSFRETFVNLQHQVEALRGTMHDESDRVIAEITYGPHNKILDPDIQEVWKQVGCRGGVKGEGFVAALLEYFREKFNKNNVTLVSDRPHQDAWALKFMNSTRAQGIIEAFDDEAPTPSRNITVTKVNAFITGARPDNWSLFHWLAYWAFGRQLAMRRYAEQIDTLLAKMFAIKRDVLPANRNSVDQYLHHVWTRSTTLSAAFRGPDMVDRRYLDQFESYIRSYQQCLQQNLEDVKYKIGAEDMLSRICGPGPIEKHIFPLLYLLLKRDFEIMRLARKECLHMDELKVSMQTILLVFTAVDKRYGDLADSFKQQLVDPCQQFTIFAFGIFKYMNDQSEISKLKFQDILYDDTKEAQDIDHANIIKYPLRTFGEEPFAANSIGDTQTDTQADSMVRKILGHWAGFCGETNLYPFGPMISLNLRASPDDRKRFQCTGTSPDGTAWNLVGEYTTITDMRTVHYTFSITYDTARHASQYFSAELDEGETMLSGSWGYCHSDKPSTFIFKRLPSDIMCFYPTPTELTKNKARALWQFAFHAVCDQESKKRAAWWWLRKRWETGQRYAKLIVRKHLGTSPLTTEEVVELARCERAMTWEEARFFNMVVDQCESFVPIHWGIQCNACHKEPIRGSRILCITCGLADSINLCGMTPCLTATVRLEVHHHCAHPHRPSHDIIKLYTAIHPIREHKKVYDAAQSASENLRRTFVDLSSRGSPGSHKHFPKCMSCRKYVTSLPCWCCIECKDTFVCVSCDAKHGGITIRKHKDTHALVRCQSLLDPKLEPELEYHSPAARGPLERTLTPPNEQPHYIDELLRHPMKVARAMGAKATAWLRRMVYGGS